MRKYSDAYIEAAGRICFPKAYVPTKKNKCLRIKSLLMDYPTSKNYKQKSTLIEEHNFMIGSHD